MKMESEPLISIVIPVYNIERYILRCLKSISGQSYRNLEIIVVDDGSTDGSDKVCDEFVTTDKRVRVFHKKNGGLSDARNFGIKKANGDMIALVDGDDYVKEDYIRAMYEMMVTGGVDVVICGYNDEVPKAEIVSGKEAVERLLIRQDNMEIVAWNKLYKKKLFEEIAYPIGEKYEDTLTTYKLLAEAKKVAYVQRSLYCYEMRPGSIMDAKEYDERLLIRERAAKEARQYLSGDKKLQKAAEVALLLAKYAWVDASLSGKVKQKYGDENLEWIKGHKKKYKKNKYMTIKLRIYDKLVGLGFYKIFRKIV